MRIVVHIDRLVVEGIALPPQHAAVLGETLRAELEGRLAQTLARGELDVTALTARSGAHRLVVADPVRVPPPPTAAALGPAVAGATLRGLTEGAR
jgi:hypothetical protein